MWGFIIVAVLSTFAAGLLYISFRTAGIPFVKKAAGGKKALAVLMCFAFYAALTAALALVFDVINALICMIHLYVFWLICELVAYIIYKIRKTVTARVFTCAAALICTALYLTYGWIAVHHVRQTAYTFGTAKIKEAFRIVQITDSHIGATFDGDGFARELEKIDPLLPDCVVVTGDFVDDDTKREDMLKGCDALGKLKTKYGVYFIWGNHDKGYFGEERRGWTNAELRERLEANGVILLEDESVAVADDFYIAGRCDRSDRSGRMSAQQLIDGLDKSKYIIVLDHQPHDFDAEAEAGADLVLCGHTHGGQFIPITHVGEWIGENDMRYGHERRQNTDFIVSSGISNWAFKFKTGCFSEIVIIDIVPE